MSHKYFLHKFNCRLFWWMKTEKISLTGKNFTLSHSHWTKQKHLKSFENSSVKMCHFLKKNKFAIHRVFAIYPSWLRLAYLDTSFLNLSQHFSTCRHWLGNSLISCVSSKMFSCTLLVMTVWWVNRTHSMSHTFEFVTLTCKNINWRTAWFLWEILMENKYKMNSILILLSGSKTNLKQKK